MRNPGRGARMEGVLSRGNGKRKLEAGEDRVDSSTGLRTDKLSWREVWKRSKGKAGPDGRGPGSRNAKEALYLLGTQSVEHRREAGRKRSIDSRIVHRKRSP